jgi:succinate-semialdehyde dehydrogenase/glutarate-semialdehyde dehydrogenase
MRAAARMLPDRAGTYARLMAEEMGKPISDGIAEAQKCALTCDYFAEHAEPFLAHQSVALDGTKRFAAFKPLGVILALGIAATVAFLWALH